MSGPAASWRAIRDEAERRIARRIWSPGALIPGEEALAREFGCSRATVNRALRDLAQAGLLDRKRKAGTRVAAAPTRRAVLDIPVIRREIEARGAAYRHDLLERVVARPPEPARTRLQLADSDTALHLRAAHCADGSPAIYEDRWVSLKAAPQLAEAALPEGGANEWLVRNIPATTGEIAFLAANASEREAALFDVAPGAALFVMERLTSHQGAPVTVVRLAYAPGYRLTTTL